MSENEGFPGISGTECDHCCAELEDVLNCDNDVYHLSVLPRDGSRKLCVCNDCIGEILAVADTLGFTFSSGPDNLDSITCLVMRVETKRSYSVKDLTNQEMKNLGIYREVKK